MLLRVFICLKLQSRLYFRCIFIFIYVSFLLQRKRAVPAHDSFCFAYVAYFTNGIFHLC